MTSSSLYKNTTQAESTEEDQQEQEETMNTTTSITSHLYIKPTHSSQTLDKGAVLKRIRHRKRMNKVRSTLYGLFGWNSSSGKADKAVPVQQKKWVDDAFAAP